MFWGFFSFSFICSICWTAYALFAVVSIAQYNWLIIPHTSRIKCTTRLSHRWKQASQSMPFLLKKTKYLFNLKYQTLHCCISLFTGEVAVSIHVCLIWLEELHHNHLKFNISKNNNHKQCVADYFRYECCWEKRFNLLVSPTLKSAIQKSYTKHQHRFKVSTKVQYHPLVVVPSCGMPKTWARSEVNMISYQGVNTIYHSPRCCMLHICWLCFRHL